MTRQELIKSDEYITATIECIVMSGKPVTQTRKELNDFFLQYRNELQVELSNLKRAAEELRQRLIDKIEQNRIGYASLYAGNKLTDKDWRLIYEEAIKDWLDEVPKEELRQRVKDLEAGAGNAPCN